jgi:hypothetical protein
LSISRFRSRSVIYKLINAPQWEVLTRVVFLPFVRNWSRLTFKRLWWDVKSISAYLIFLGLAGDSRLKRKFSDWRFSNSQIEDLKFSYEGQTLKVRYGTFPNCKLLADSKNVQILLFVVVEGSWYECYHMWYLHLVWRLKLSFGDAGFWWNFFNNRYWWNLQSRKQIISLNFFVVV